MIGRYDLKLSCYEKVSMPNLSVQLPMIIWATAPKSPRDTSYSESNGHHWCRLEISIRAVSSQQPQMQGSNQEPCWPDKLRRFLEVDQIEIWQSLQPIMAAGGLASSSPSRLWRPHDPGISEYGHSVSRFLARFQIYPGTP